MLGTIGLVFGGFAWLILGSYRSARKRAEEGDGFRPEGKLRWPETREPGI